jgi:hypothetical protein
MSFFIVDPSELQRIAALEGETLTGTEKAAKEQLDPGHYIIVQVVRELKGSEVPARVRWDLQSTRTRAPRSDKGKAKAKSKSNGAAASAPEA